jgi:hypothetical protein
MVKMDDIRDIQVLGYRYEINGMWFSFSIEQDGDREVAVFSGDNYCIYATPHDGIVEIAVTDAHGATVYDYRDVNDCIPSKHAMFTFELYLDLVENVVSDILWTRIAEPYRLFTDG